MPKQVQKLETHRTADMFDVFIPQTPYLHNQRLREAEIDTFTMPMNILACN